jgi:NAD(P)-dependent dehydrogenase (short-subunit alcohol dehydrogenase family)
MTTPHDRVALVTGAGSDIGRAVAHGLLADGSVRPEPRLDLRDAADAAQHMAHLPLSATVNFMTVMATQMPYVGRG